MKNKYIIILIFIVFILLCFSFNKDENNMEIQISSETKNVFELVNTIYTDDELNEISNLDYSIDTLNSKYPIECIRDEDNLYKVVYRGKDSFLVIYFDQDGTKVFGNIFKQSITLEELKKINKGTNLEVVMNIDNNGNYINFYTDIDSPKVSEHYTNDGYLITMSYDKNYNISDIKYKLL